MSGSHLSPASQAVTKLDEDGRQTLRDNLKKLALRSNISGDETIVNEGEYLEVAAVRA